MSSLVIDRDAPGIPLVRLSRPPVNALTSESIAELTAVLRAEVDAGARALVLTGDGGCFCAGLDLKLVGAYDDGQTRAMVADLDELMHVLYTLPIPTVCAVNGHALAGGLILPLSCDVRIATTADCRLGLTEVRAGVPFPEVPMQVVLAELSAAAARLLCLTGMTMAGEQAKAMGLVDELAAPDGLVARAMAVATDLAGLELYPQIKAHLRRDVAAAMAAARAV